MKNKLFTVFLSTLIITVQLLSSSDENLTKDSSLSPVSVDSTLHHDIKPTRSFYKRRKRLPVSVRIVPTPLCKVDEEFDCELSALDAQQSVMSLNPIENLFSAIHDGKFDYAAALTRDIAHDGKFSPIINKQIQRACHIFCQTKSYNPYKKISDNDDTTLLLLDQINMLSLINATNYAGALTSPYMQVLREKLASPGISDEVRLLYHKEIDDYLEPYK